MPEKTTTEAPPADPLVAIQECLETGPPHTRVRYQKEPEKAPTRLPLVLNLYCEPCQGLRNWRRVIDLKLPGMTVRSSALAEAGSFIDINDRSVYSQAEYRCSNCQEAIVRFWFSWPPGLATFTKFAQNPPLKPRISPTLAAKLTGEAKGQYLKALEEFNEGKYIGAVSYLRRVVDDKMNEFLDGLATLAREEHVSEEALARLEEMKRARFSEKAEYARLITPPALQAGDVNPIAFLYQLSSDGLHNRPEEECREIFSACRNVFEEVFERVAIREERAKNYAESIAAMHAANNPQAKKKKTTTTT